MRFHFLSPKGADKDTELGDDAEAADPDLNDELKELEKKLQLPKAKIEKKKPTKRGKK